MKVTYKSLIMLAAISTGLVACEKNLLKNAIPETFPNDPTMSYVKFIHAYAGKAPALTSGAGPAMFLYSGTQKLNSTAANAFAWAAFGGQFPAPSSATTNARSWYCALQYGSTTFYGVQARVSGSTPAPVAGDTVFRRTVALEGGKSYVAVFGDTAQSPSITMLPDDYGTLTENKYKIRLANFLAWPDDVQELYSTREGRVIQSNITYKTAGNYIELDRPRISDTLIIRKVSGSSPGTYAINIFGFFPTGKRAYTVFTRGKQLTGTSTVFQNISTIVTTNY